jgi:hypothetical protein
MANNQKTKLPYPRHKDFTVNGEMDWNAWDTTLRQRGYACIECGGAIILADATGPKKCYTCSLAKCSSAWESPKRIRCPGCATLLDPHPALPEGMLVPLKQFNIAVQCTQCQTVFEFLVKLEYAFTSPALIDHEAKNERQPAERDAKEASQILEEIVPRE